VVNIIMTLEEMRWEGVDWVHVIQDMDQWRYCNEPWRLYKRRKFLD
jgi:hypothetical protein